ncbi:MAG TPA: hypothetical protein VFI73_03875 [Candidatus Nitrosopolaris sp.]|nr:hypothetical protein [Candidatus Nitrosopolaris sp.]
MTQDTTIQNHGMDYENVGKGFRIAKVYGDTKKMKYYAEGIRKFQRELKTSVSEFPRFALLGRKMPEELDSTNYSPDSNSCSQTQKELEVTRISIRYNSRELRWIKSSTGGHYSFRPYNGRDVGIESWQVFLPQEDITREILKNEMISPYF